MLEQSLNRLDGPLKVSGPATYAAEARLQGMAYGVLVQAAIPAGQVLDLGNAPGAMAMIYDNRMIRFAAQGMAEEALKSGPDAWTTWAQPSP